MNKTRFLNSLPWILAVFIAIIFVQSLFFKFSNSYETQHIFGTIGEWMAGLPLLNPLATGFTAYGGYVIGSTELLASILLLIRATQSIGAVIAWLVMSGAIFFHLFTPLGVSVVIDESGQQDGGQLFTLAVLVWLSAIAIAWLRRQDFGQIFRARNSISAGMAN